MTSYLIIQATNNVRKLRVKNYQSQRVTVKMILCFIKFICVLNDVKNNERKAELNVLSGY